jgi:carbon storage regulator CsrA
MLVLTRKIGETVVIEGGIHITVVAVQGKKVRLAIDAPPWVRVDRKEVHDRRAQDGCWEEMQPASPLAAASAQSGKERSRELILA